MISKRIINIAIIFLAATTTCAIAASAKYPRQTPIVEAFIANKDAVVSISSKQIYAQRSDIFSWGFDWPFSRPQYKVIPSLGSGFIVDPHGYIITNAHVVAHAVEISIIMADEKSYQAKIVKANETMDLAVLKIDSNEPLPTVVLGCSDDLMVGETVLAIGNPFGYQHTLTEGIISAIHRNLTLSDDIILPEVVQISAPINPGNSGGPLLNINGQVIGINTAIRRAAQGIGFAIPIDRLRDSVTEMLDIEKLYRADFGLKIAESLPTAESSKKGVLVQSVRPGSAAEKAGFQQNDIIKSIDTHPINSTITFYLTMLNYQIGDELTFSVSKGQSSRKITMSLTQRPLPDAGVLAKELFGIELMGINHRTAKRFDLLSTALMIRSLERYSSADSIGLKPGDIIASIAGVEIDNTETLALELEKITTKKDPVPITVLRVLQNGRSIYQLKGVLQPRISNISDDSDSVDI